MTSPSTREIKVKDITDEIDNWVIKVRVLRSWPIFDSIELDDMITLEVVLIDSEGSKIQGSIAVEVVCARCFNLNEGEYYEIGCVVVVENDGLERMTDHPFKLVFWSGSIVEPWEPAPFSAYGLSVVQVVPNATKLVFNPPIVEVGCYVILATITAIDGNDDWRHLYTNAKPKANERSKFPVSHLHDCLIPRYNVKANVFDGVESRGFYLDDHHVIDYLTKSSSQSIGVDDPFECMVGTQFLFIVKKTCDHKVDQDGCFKTLSFCGDPEILRIFSERDCYLLDSWAKIAMLTSLKKTCPIEDSFLKSNRAKSTWGVRSDRVLNPTYVASTSSSMGLVESSLPMLADCMRVLHK
ncbi:Nucleic acid-binding, OB-fold [Sesbania bispinosa]|nr:Nucleic acid-binding, OB-fold [Sesbania bispinosa]